jgi:hypothetical protein
MVMQFQEGHTLILEHSMLFAFSLLHTKAHVCKIAAPRAAINKSSKEHDSHLL